jgi:hypothetical protein
VRLLSLLIFIDLKNVKINLDKSYFNNYNFFRLPLNVHPFLLHRRPFLLQLRPFLLHIRPPQIGLAITQLGLAARNNHNNAHTFFHQPTILPTYHPPYLIAAMDLAPPSVGELYVSHEELIVAANTWAGAHDYALNIKRSSKNKRGIKDKIWLKCDRGGKCTSPVGQKRLHAGSRLIECPFKAIAK